MKDTAWMGGSITVHRVFLYPLIYCVLAFAPILAHAASQDDAAKTEDFQKGEAFTVRKAMDVIFGNVDEQNRSTFIPASPSREYIDDTYFFSVTTVKWKAFELNKVETVFLYTRGVPLNIKDKRVCTKCDAFIGMYVFKKMDDRWKLSVSDTYNHVAPYKDVTLDFVKIGKDQVAFAINDGGCEIFEDFESKSSRWTRLYTPVDGTLKWVFGELVYVDNRGGCVTKWGPGKVNTKYHDVSGLPDFDRIAHTCHRFKTEIYVLPSDSKFYTLRTVTTDTLKWKGPDGRRLPPNRLEWDFQFSENMYLRVMPIPATGPMVPLFDKDSDFQRRRQSLEKRPRGWIGSN